VIIGKFTRSGDAYTGKLVTLTVRQALKFEPAERGADYEVSMDGFAVGAAWKKTAKDTGKGLSLGQARLAVPAGARERGADRAGRRDAILVWNRDQRKAD
jgi:uncharacterized protein (DUF736 family)